MTLLNLVFVEIIYNHLMLVIVHLKIWNLMSVINGVLNLFGTLLFNTFYWLALLHWWNMESIRIAHREFFLINFILLCYLFLWMQITFLLIFFQHRLWVIDMRLQLCTSTWNLSDFLDWFCWHRGLFLGHLELSKFVNLVLHLLLLYTLQIFYFLNFIGFCDRNFFHVLLGVEIVFIRVLNWLARQPGNAFGLLV